MHFQIPLKPLNLSGAKIVSITGRWIALCVKKETAYFIRQTIGTVLTVNANDDLTQVRTLKNEYGESIISSKEGGEMMKVYITHTDTKYNEGEIRECESLESCCESLLDTEDFNGFVPELVISKPDMESPLDEKSKSCKWCIEIYDNYR